MTRIAWMVTLAATLAAAFWWQRMTIDGLHEALDTERRAVATLEAARAASVEAVARLQDDIKARDEAIAQRDRRVAAIEKEREAARRAFKEVLRNDEGARAWADVPVPDAVHRLLGKGGARARADDGTGSAAGSADAGNAGSGMDGQNQRGSGRIQP